MRAAAVAEAEGTGGEVERLAGENVAGPGAGAARKNDRVHSAFAVDFGFNSNERRIGRGAVGIVAAGHADFDIAETFFREMSFESGKGFGGGHVWNEAQVEFGDGFSGKNRFSARAGVAPDEAFNLHSGARPQRSPLEINSHSMTPFAPSVMVTSPSRPCEALGIKMPMQFFSAASTSGRRTTCGKCGEPISSSPSATKTRLTGSFLPAPRMAWRAARNEASGPF